MEEQLYICERSKDCKGKGNYPHCIPHEKCYDGDYCYYIEGRQKCIPVQEIKYDKNSEISCPFNMPAPHASHIVIAVGGAYCGRMADDNLYTYGPKYNCRYCAGINKNHQVIYCVHPKEEKVEEIKYKVVKPFTMPDYILAHQKKYNWTSFKDSCKELQQDMDVWINHGACDFEEGIFNVFIKPKFSDNFYKNGAIFGFIEMVEPEVMVNIFNSKIKRPLSKISDTTPIFAMKDGRMVGLLIKEEKGWIVRIGYDRGAYGYTQTKEENITKCSTLDITFWVY